MSYADKTALAARARLAWRPPPRLTLSEWADRHYVLSAESAAEPGPWKTLPYQRGLMDATTDPRIEQVSIMKSARIGYTLCVSALVGYHIHQDPASILMVQPTVDDAKNYSKETIATMLRDVPVLAAIRYRDLEDKGPKDSSNTLTHKAFPGGVLSLIGANSGSGFRRISRRVVIFDEVDAYPASAGSEGDPISLGMKRARSFWNRKIIAGSTPLIAGASRIAELFEAGDQRRYYVPCPTCDHKDFLTFSEGDRGHWMHWSEGKPEKAHFICRGCGCEIEHKHKRWMIERGEWRADAPFRGHASFHIWAAYSYSPNDTWGQLAKEFLEAKRGGAEKLRTFVNTVLGETWVEKGEAPDWLRLFQRREPYPLRSVPPGVIFLTAGVDVQKDRFVYEVVGWGHDKQSWSIEADVIPCDTALESSWSALDQLLARSWSSADGLTHSIHTLAVDSGYNANVVYNWGRGYPLSRVIATKGVSFQRTLIGAPTSVDVNVRGKRLARGYKVWPIGVDVAKAELYGWLRMESPKPGEPSPAGWCHFPEHGEDYFKQLTAEHLVQIRKRTGHIIYEWQVQPGRENHWLDCRVGARAAAARAGLDRHAASARAQASPAQASTPTPAPQTSESAQQPIAETPSAKPAAKKESWLRGGRGFLAGRGSWLGGRR